MSAVKKAYEAGVRDGQMAGIQPSDLKFVQDFNEFDGEELVCYLNGVGDGIAGYDHKEFTEPTVPASLADVDRAIAAIPAPTCFADYGKVYRVLSVPPYFEEVKAA